MKIIKYIRTEVQEVLNMSTTWGHTDVEADQELCLYQTELLAMDDNNTFPQLAMDDDNTFPLFLYLPWQVFLILEFQIKILSCIVSPWRVVGDKNGTVTMKQEYNLPNLPSFENCENVRFYISSYHYTHFTNCTEEVHYMQHVHSFCLHIALSRVIKNSYFPPSPQAVRYLV